MFKDKKIIKYIVIIFIYILGIISGNGMDFLLSPKTTEVITEIINSIELADEQVQAVVEDANGELIELDAPTVLSVESNRTSDCDDEECGLGDYIYAPTESPVAFKNYVLGKCLNSDNKWGAQCWDLADVFWQNYAGRRFSTCGTGAAKGSWNCKEQNAGDNFVLIENPADLQLGDWVIFSTGKYGHVGMALGGYNNGYVALLGQNQGGAPCAQGGSSANIINMNLGTFVGAFRPKSYIKSEPAPTLLPISGCIKWHVERGDTMSKIMLDCEGTIKYGTAMDEYAKSWYSIIYRPGQSVYDGWQSRNGVGLYAGDDIEHRTK